MFLHVDYRDQMPIMRELYRLKDIGGLTQAQADGLKEHPIIFVGEGAA